MYALSIAWRNIRNRLVEALVPIFVVALAIGLSVAVLAVSDGVRRGIIRASDPFGVLVVGKAGSGQELVLSSILLQGNPIGNIDYTVYETLENDNERVQLAVPLAFGDSVDAQRLIGTNRNFFELRTDQRATPAFQVREGRFFDDESSFEAVFGSKAATATGLQIGDTFKTTHGIGQGIAENAHEDEYTVVGILQPSGTAYDTAVYTQLESIWDAHNDEHDDEAHEDEDEILPIPQNNLVVAEAAGAPIHGQVTAVLVLPASFIGQNQIAQEYYLDPLMQAAFPGRELGSILNLLGQAQQILNVIGYLVLGIAGLTVFLSMYSAILSRQQSIAIMRSLGSSRWDVFNIVIFETLIVSIVGALIGRLVGYGVAWLIASVYSAQNALPIPIRFIPELELLLWGLSIGVGILAGLIPALLAYRVNIVEKLFPN